MLNFYSGTNIRIGMVALAVGVVGIVSADEVRVAGSTQGQFDAQAFANTNSLLDLVYSNSTFDNTTVGNAMDLGGDPTPGTNFNNLGSFTLGNTNNFYNGHTFKLQVTFTAPSTIVGGNQAVFTDTVSGTVSNGLGGVFIDFDNTPQTFNFSNAQANGSFTFFVNDLSIAPSGSASLTGHITGRQTSVPEASSIAGVMAGMLGLSGLLRKRK
jgi:hypothetical protein